MSNIKDTQFNAPPAPSQANSTRKPRVRKPRRQRLARGSRISGGHDSRGCVVQGGWPRVRDPRRRRDDPPVRHRLRDRRLLDRRRPHRRRPALRERSAREAIRADRSDPDRDLAHSTVARRGERGLKFRFGRAAPRIGRNDDPHPGEKPPPLAPFTPGQMSWPSMRAPEIVGNVSLLCGEVGQVDSGG